MVQKPHHDSSDQVSATFVPHGSPRVLPISTTGGVGKVSAGKASAPPPAELARPAVLAGLGILIVDDDDDARELLRFVLETCDVVVLEAASASEALAKVQTEKVDLLVSDIGMPVEDGYSLIRNIRALSIEEKANIPAIALTAFARKEDRNRALLEGFDIHLAKPAILSELLAALADLGERSRGS